MTDVLTVALFVLLSAPDGLVGAVVPQTPSGNSSLPADDAERKTAARALFQEGLAHADGRRWSEAADRFERARALRPSAEISYNLSTALHGLGKLVRSSEILRAIIADAQASPAVKTAARTRLAEVLPRLAHLTVNLPPALLTQGASAHFDGQSVDVAQLGVSLLTDPAFHVVELRHSSTVLERREIALREGERRTVSFGDLRLPSTAVASATTVPAAVATPTNTAANATTDAPTGRPDVIVATPRRASASSNRRWWLWGIVGGVVAVGLTAALVAANSGSDPVPSANVDTWRLGPQ